MKWDRDETHAFLWIAIEAAKSLVGSMKNKVGTRFTSHLSYVKDHKFSWCTLEEENEKVGRFLVERFKNKNFVKKFVKDYRKFDKNTIKTLDKLDKTDFSKISSNKLFNILKAATNLYIRNFDWGFIIEPMDFVMPKMLEPGLRSHKYTRGEISDMFAIADIIYINKEAQEMIKIAKSPKNRQEQLLKKHAYRYRWMQSAHMGRQDIPLSHFRNELNNIKKKNLDKELNKLKNSKINALKRKKQILKNKPLGKETKTLLKIADIIAPLHDRRKELFLRTIYTLDTARAEIAKRYGYTKEELAPYRLEDILKLKQGKKIDHKKAGALSKEALLYVDTKKNIWKFYSGKKAGQIFRRETKEDLSNIMEIKGMIASPGIAIGTAQIIFGMKDLDKMKQGNILVTSMTKPEYIPALRKASAIVTDEGGITCHAAIVSREFRIPCIIGTKNASRALKDGDKIEVDANKGIVKKIR